MTPAGRDNGTPSASDDASLPEAPGSVGVPTSRLVGLHVPASTIDFCEALTAAVPDLTPVLADHRAANRAGTLPHVFMGDVARWYMEHWASGDAPSARRLSDWLDTVYPTADEYVQNVIDVSFLENLPWPHDPDAAADELLGPNLSRELGALQRWTPGV